MKKKENKKEFKKSQKIIKINNNRITTHLGKMRPENIHQI